MAPGISLRVAARHVRALEDSDALNVMADRLVDELLDLVAPPGENEVARAFEQAGVSSDQLNELEAELETKTAGFGGTVKGLMRLLARPFLNLGRLFTSEAFRGQVKGAFRKALSHELRATRHALSVAGRLARGEPVKPQERKAALKQLLALLVTVVISVTAGPDVQGLFSGSLWKAFQTVVVPVQKIVGLLLRQPIYDAATKLLFAS